MYVVSHLYKKQISTSQKLDFPGCGLPCKYNQVYWGLHNSDTHMIDLSFWIYTTIFLLISTILWINHCMDIKSFIKSSQESCIHRPLLFHAPFCIAINLVIGSLCFIIPLIIGKDSTVCSEDINNIQTMAIINPGASIPCTISGLSYSVSILMAGVYTAIFSMTLWKQFYAPLNSIWTEIKHKSYCKCLNHNCCCFEIFDKCCNAKVYQSNKTKIFIHFLCWCIAIIYSLFAWRNQEINSLDPLGICLVGANSVQDNIFRYNILPHAITLGVSVLFFPAAIILLYRLRTHGDQDMKIQHKKLSCRLLIFFICVLSALFLMLLVTTAAVNYFCAICKYDSHLLW